VPDPWFTAERGAPGHDEPCVSLLERSFLGGRVRYVLTLDSARHLRDHLSAALDGGAEAAILAEAARWQSIADSYRDTVPDCDTAKEARRLARWLRALALALPADEDGRGET
jgi:hypothetical protein